MVNSGATTEQPQFEGSVEPIERVLARLVPVHVETMSAARCEAWLADAGRVSGWLAAVRSRVQERHHLLWLASRPGPHGADDLFGDDPEGGPDSGNRPDDRRDNPDGVPGGGTPGSVGHDPAGTPGDGPADGAGPSPEPGTQSAKEKARLAKLRRGFRLLPSFETLLDHGRITADHVLALDAVRNRTAASAREHEFTGAAVAHTAEGFAAWLRIWDAEVDLAERLDPAGSQHARRALHLFGRTGDLGEFRGALPPAVFDAFRRSLEAIDAELRRSPAADRSASYAQRMADALVELVHRANTRGAGGGGDSSLRTAVVVLIHLDDLLSGTGHGVTVDGTPIDVGEVRRLAAREHVIPMVLGADSVPLDLGRAQRYATDHQWLALLARDGGCAHCDAPLGPLDAHHTPPWHLGGRTDLATLRLLCRRCHRAAHATDANRRAGPRSNGNGNGNGRTPNRSARRARASASPLRPTPSGASRSERSVPPPAPRTPAPSRPPQPRRRSPTGRSRQPTEPVRSPHTAGPLRTPAAPNPGRSPVEAHAPGAPRRSSPGLDPGRAARTAGDTPDQRRRSGP